MSGIFSSTREFQVWHFTVSHSTFLLRSVKTEDTPTRIEILFKPVSFIQIPTRFKGLSIREVDIDSLGEHNVIPNVVPQDKIFELTCGNFKGYVAAYSCNINEDEGEYGDKSSFDIFPSLV